MRIRTEPAIYKFENVVTKDFYVGATRNAQGRRRDHYSDLKLERHRNPRLQDDFLALGKNVTLFEFTVLEYLDVNFTDDEIVRREQEWMDFLQPTYNSRNALPRYGRDIDLERQRSLAGRKGRVQSQEEKDKRAKAVREFWATHEPKVISEYQKNMISEKMSGDKHPLWGKPVPESRRNAISDGVSKTEYTFMNPEGNKVVFRNMKRFCQDNHLGTTSFSRLMRGLIPEYKGWRFLSKRRI